MLLLEALNVYVLFSLISYLLRLLRSSLTSKLLPFQKIGYEVLPICWFPISAINAYSAVEAPVPPFETGIVGTHENLLLLLYSRKPSPILKNEVVFNEKTPNHNQ